VFIGKGLFERTVTKGRKLEGGKPDGIRMLSVTYRIKRVKRSLGKRELVTECRGSEQFEHLILRLPEKRGDLTGTKKGTKIGAPLGRQDQKKRIGE